MRAEIDIIYGFFKCMYSFKISSIGRETIPHPSIEKVGKLDRVTS